MNGYRGDSLRRGECQRGVSLIEVLVALVIASIGLLGVAALVMGALRATTQAEQNAVASVVAYDVADRFWLASAAGVDDCDLDEIGGLRADDQVSALPGATFNLSEEDGDCVFQVFWEAGTRAGDGDDAIDLACRYRFSFPGGVD